MEPPQPEDCKMLQETEMREFFNQVISDFTGLSEQARKVEELSQRVQSLSDQVSVLQTENSNLKRDVNEAWEYAKRMEATANERSNLLRSAEDHAKALQDLIVASDGRVRDLTNQAVDANNTVATMTHELDVAHGQVKDYEILVADLRQQLTEVTTQRDEWKADAQHNAETIATLNATLSRVQSILNPTPVETNIEPFPQFNVG